MASLRRESSPAERQETVTSALDKAAAGAYKPHRPRPERRAGAQVAQLVEHATENRSVGGSIPPLGTIHTFSVVSFFPRSYAIALLTA